MELAILPQLNFSLDNPVAPDTIYVSTNAADNRLTLVATATVAATFTAGTLVPPDQAAGGSGSPLYLDLTTLGLTVAEFAALSLSAPGWTSERYSQAGSQIIGFTPTQRVQLPTSGHITLALAGFTLAQQPGANANLTVLAYRVPGVTTGSFPISSNLTVVFSFPDNQKQNLRDAIAVMMTPNQVVNSIAGYPEVKNQLLLTLFPGQTPATINATADTVFTLSFIYASDPNGFGALLTAVEGAAVKVEASEGTTNWAITPHPNADSPYWTLVPPAGEPILGSSAQQSSSLAIGNLVTSFQAGPTLALLTYSGVPGYKNGTYSILLQKVPHVAIETPLTVRPDPTQLVNGAATVTVSWVVHHAGTLILSPPPQDVTGQTSAAVAINKTTSFTLEAQGLQLASAGNVAFASVTAHVQPVVIRSFQVDVNPVDLAHGPQKVTLSWDVANAASIEIEGIGRVIGTSVRVPVSATQTFVLSAAGSDPLDLQTATLTVWSVPDYLATRTFTLNDSEHEVFQSYDGTWRTDANLVEKLLFSEDGSGQYSYSIDGASASNHGLYYPIHDSWSGKTTWTFANGMLTVNTDKGPIVVAVSGGRLVYQKALQISFVRKQNTFTPGAP